MPCSLVSCRPYLLPNSVGIHRLSHNALNGGYKGYNIHEYTSDYGHPRSKDRVAIVRKRGRDAYSASEYAKLYGSVTPPIAIRRHRNRRSQHPP